MKPKYKVTGCARFFVFLIIFLPIVFFGAAYLRGENGVQIVKDFWGDLTGKDKTEIRVEDRRDAVDQSDRIRQLETELKEAKERIRELEEQLKTGK